METETGIPRYGKTPITTRNPIEDFSRFSIFVEIVRKIKSGEKREAVVSIDPFKILLHERIVNKIIKDHGCLPAENFILTVNNPTTVMNFTDKAGKDKLNILKEFPCGTFLIGAEKYLDCYFTVTFFEIKDKTYLASIKGRGRLVFSSGGVAVPSSAIPS